MSKDTNILCRKLKLVPVGDKEEINRVYKFIRNGQYAQYKAANILMGELASSFYKNKMDLNSEQFKSDKKEILTNNNELLKGLDFATGVDTVSLITQKVSQDFNISIKNGLSRGERSITNYKRENPLLTRNRSLKFYHNYNSYTEFLDHLYKPDLEVFISWVNKIKFKIVIGNLYRSQYLRAELQQIFEENYKICGSSIQINDKSIILNLSMEVPKKEIELDKNKVVGVKQGITVPAVCVLNTNMHMKKAIGSMDDFLRIRLQLQAQRSRIQSNLKIAKGGHGRKRKLQALNKLEQREKHFASTYNHMISKNVVKFAIDNKAKYINLENIKQCDVSKFALRNWSYYQLQQYIIYKAKTYGIEVRIINTEQKNEEQDMKADNAFQLQKTVEEDYVNAMNIATATDFVGTKKKKK